MDLLHAAESGRLSRVKDLVNKDKSCIQGCQHENGLNRAFNVNGSAIHYACRSGHYNVVKYLLEQDPTLINVVDIEDWTPLHYACYNGHIRIVRLLLDYNADVHLKDNYLSQTPIEFAMYRQFEEIVALLNPNAQWKRREADEITQKGNTPVFRKGSQIFLGRFQLQHDHIEQIQNFRQDPRAARLELRSVVDHELHNLHVRLILDHDYHQHMKETNDLASLDDQHDDGYLRSSTTSTNEHLLVLIEQ